MQQCQRSPYSRSWETASVSSYKVESNVTLSSNGLQQAASDFPRAPGLSHGYRNFAADQRQCNRKSLPQPPTTGFYCNVMVKTQPAWSWLSLATSQDDAPLSASSDYPRTVRTARASQLWLAQVDSCNHATWCNLQTRSLTTAPKWATVTSHTGARWEHLVLAHVFPKPEVWWRFCWGEKMQEENITSCDTPHHGKLPVFTFMFVYLCCSH